MKMENNKINNSNINQEIDSIHQERSLMQETWRRLKKNKLAMEATEKVTSIVLRKL